MAINDMKYIWTEVKRKNLNIVLSDLGRIMNSYCETKMKENGSAQDFLDSFPTHPSEHISLEKDFFVQKRLNPKGRLLVGYDKNENRLRVTITDNGEGVPEQTFDEITSTLKKYFSEHNISIINEGTRKEF